MQTKTIAELAGEAYDAFTTTERGEETIVVLKDGAPEWVQDLVREAHEDFLPDDWRYRAIRSALSSIHDDDPDDLDDFAGEWADQHVDTYTHARLQWLASNLSRPAYCDEATEEFRPAGDIVAMIGMGQYMECREVFASVALALESRANELSEDEV